MTNDVNFLQSKMITYAIDASSANKEKRTGVENYARHLIEAMKHDPLREGERVVLFSPSVLTGALSDLPSGWESHVFGWPFPNGWMQGRVSFELLSHQPDVLFIPAQSIPIFRFGTPILTTIHDIAFRRVAPLYDPIIRRRLLRTTKRSIKHATSLLAVSEFTRSEMRSFYQIPDNKITVTPLSSDTAVYRRLDPQQMSDTLQTYRLGNHFFLFVGRLELKKNVGLLITAFELFKQNRGVGDPFELVLIGEPGHGYGEIKEFIDRSPYAEFIRPLGFVPDEQVCAIMNAATAFCFPSWYEGFGIPNLEAMACGTPLLVSDIGAHREVVGDAGIFISPQDPQAWSKQMEKIVTDFSLREKLIEQGTLRVAHFSWQQTAQQTWSVLRSLV